IRFKVFLLLLMPVLVSLAQEPEKPVYYATGNEAYVAGTITLKGTLPRFGVIDMSADPICGNFNRKPTMDSLITNGGRLANAFIYVKGHPLNAYRFEVPESEVILD